MRQTAIDPLTVVDFWREAGPQKWFTKDEGFDAAIQHRFGDLYEQAAADELDGWADEATGALALVILLDQFPRNMFRGTPKAFATNGKAKAVGEAALARGDHETVGSDVNAFLAMPLMHSEDLADQDASLDWMRRIGEDANVEAALEHRDVIAKFGRFPHRNAILGRESSAAEEAYLADGGFSG